MSFYAVFSFQLVDASTLKKEVAEGVDLMVVRELTGGQHTDLQWFDFLLWTISLLGVIMYPNFLLEIGIYFGKPRGFSINENGQEIGFNTEVYASYEVFL